MKQIQAVRLSLIGIVLLGMSSLMSAQSAYSDRDHWVDSIFNEMTDAERVGQLFMVRAHSNKGEEHVQKLMDWVEEQQVGGLCFFQGNPEEQARINNLLNEKTKHVPLLVSSDAEWGLGMRLKKYGVSFPYNMMQQQAL